MKIINFKEIDSTNNYCKSLTGEEDAIVTAERQTAGRGTKGRSFVSDEGGLYITIMRTFKNFAAADSFKIMINTAVAICKTVESLGAKPIIRWANDVLVGGKKICGTLIENTFTSNGVKSIVGIGLNVTNVLPPELKDIATTLYEVTGKKFSIAEVRDALIQKLEKEYSVDDYKHYINWFGQTVTLKLSDGQVEAVAEDVESDGRLVCEIGGAIKKISCGEVSLRL